MDNNDRYAIDQLFHKLGEVERNATPRDAEAETLIRQRVAQQPGAPYYMAQTIVVQEQALEAAQQRIMQLEQQSRPGLFGGLFGGGSQRAPVAQQRSPQQRGYGQNQYGQQGYGQQGYGRPAGGGFLAGAAQTALGVAGGVLIANAITGMFDGGAEGAAVDGGDAGTGDFDGGGDFGDI